MSLWVVWTCSLVDGYQGFGEKYCFHLQRKRDPFLRNVSNRLLDCTAT
jgi:hypothetical protein